MFFSPHLCVGFLFLLLYPAPRPPPAQPPQHHRSHFIVTHLFVTHHLSHTTLSHLSLSPTTLSHTIFHTQLCHTHNFVTHHLSHTTLSHTSLSHTQICHTPLCHTQLCHTPSFTHNFVTHNFVTHHLSHTTLSHTSLPHTIFHTELCHTPLCHTQLCHTPSFTHNFVTHNFVTHHLSHTTLSHTSLSHTQLCHTPLCHTQLCHTPSFTTLSHTTLLHTIFHTQLCHTPLCHTPSFTQSFVTPLFVTHNFVTHHLSHTTLSQTTSLHTTFHAQLCYTCLFVTHLFGTFRHPTLFAWPLVALGWLWWRAWVPLVAVTPRHFAWQAWRLATSTFVSRGRRGTWRHSPSFCVAGTALSLRGRPGPDCTGLDLVAGLGAVSRPWRRGTLRGAWHLVTSTFVLRGKRGTVRHPHSLCVAGVALIALGWLSWRGRRAGVALGDIHLRFAWQAWHLAVLRGRRGAYGTGLALLAWRAWHSATSTLALRQVKLCGSRGTCSHRPTFCMFYFCACLIETLWKRCLHMLQPTACRPCLAMSYLHTVFGCICYFVTWLSISGLVALAQCGKRPCACLIDTLWKRCWPVSACLIET